MLQDGPVGATSNHRARVRGSTALSRLRRGPRSFRAPIAAADPAATSSIVDGSGTDRCFWPFWFELGGALRLGGAAASTPEDITIARTHVCISEFFMGFPILRPRGGADVRRLHAALRRWVALFLCSAELARRVPREVNSNMTERAGRCEKSPCMRTLLRFHASIVLDLDHFQSARSCCCATST
jgi:hypothetical protein